LSPSPSEQLQAARLFLLRWTFSDINFGLIDWILIVIGAVIGVIPVDRYWE
jgi:hypothetical protein